VTYEDGDEEELEVEELVEFGGLAYATIAQRRIIDRFRGAASDQEVRSGAPGQAVRTSCCCACGIAVSEGREGGTYTPVQPVHCQLKPRPALPGASAHNPASPHTQDTPPKEDGRRGGARRGSGESQEQAAKRGPAPPPCAGGGKAPAPQRAAPDPRSRRPSPQTRAAVHQEEDSDYDAASDEEEDEEDEEAFSADDELDSDEEGDEDDEDEEDDDEYYGRRRSTRGAWKKEETQPQRVLPARAKRKGVGSYAEMEEAEADDDDDFITVREPPPKRAARGANDGQRKAAPVKADSDTAGDEDAPPGFLPMQQQQPQPAAAVAAAKPARKAPAAKAAAPKKPRTARMAKEAVQVKTGTAGNAFLVVEGDEEISFEVIQSILDDGKQDAAKMPAKLPTCLNVLETFAGCGGFHMAGDVTFRGSSDTSEPELPMLIMRTVAAVEIDGTAATTYRANHGNCVDNVMHMGIGRFLATGRRIMALKQLDMDVLLPATDTGAAMPMRVDTPVPGLSSQDSEPGVAQLPDADMVVIDHMVDSETAVLPMGDDEVKGTMKKQCGDWLTVQAFQGRRPLLWLRFKVIYRNRPEHEASWMADMDDAGLRAAVHTYLNSSLFVSSETGCHRFPLPGDIQVITGGPPCQGWSGYNSQRPISEQLPELMKHKENQLLAHFLGCLAWYKPLYFFMEEVPNVAKPAVMSFLKDVCNDLGYTTHYERALKTLFYGIPQTRERLIISGCIQGMVLTPMPPKITHEEVKAQNDIHFAYEESKLAMPLTVDCFHDGSLDAAKERRRQEAQARVEELKLAGCQGPDIKKRAEEAAALRQDLPRMDSGDGTIAGNTSSSEEPNDVGGGASASSSRPLLRALVLGDSLSCDLPVVAHEAPWTDGKGTNLADKALPYVCDPPTSYIAYLRRKMVPQSGVKNHVVPALTDTDRLRCQSVPMFEEACWRDMMGPNGVMLRPMMLLLDDEQWKVYSKRARQSLPQYMRVKPEAQLQKVNGKTVGKTPDFEAVARQLPHGWKLEPKRAPLVPYWCLTKGMGKDKACYGRHTLTEPHATVHSYAKPHWHVSLVPFSSRVLSVRDRARVQGFFDHFVFQGDLQQQFKQIGNAVSPQLAIAIGRELLLTHARCMLLMRRRQAAEEAASDAGAEQNLPVPYDTVMPEVQSSLPPLPPHEFGETLQNFVDFLAKNDEKALQAQGHLRFAPQSWNPPPTAPATYEEILVHYNSQSRKENSHSIRYSAMTPFQVLRQAEDNHSWNIHSIVGIRVKAGATKATVKRNKENEICIPKEVFDICVLYRGFSAAQWTELSTDYVRTRPWIRFKALYGVLVEEVMTYAAPYFVLPGADPTAPVVDGYENSEEIEETFEEMEERYAQEVADGWIKLSVQKKKSRAAAAAAAAAGEDEEDGDDEPPGGEDGEEEDGAAAGDGDDVDEDSAAAAPDSLEDFGCTPAPEFMIDADAPHADGAMDDE
jgi:site-specific DNA-cytosine methylase